MKKWLLIKKPYILSPGWFFKKVISRVIPVKYYCATPVGIWQQKHWPASSKKVSILSNLTKLLAKLPTVTFDWCSWFSSGCTWIVPLFSLNYLLFQEEFPQVSQAQNPRNSVIMPSDSTSYQQIYSQQQKLLCWRHQLVLIKQDFQVRSRMIKRARTVVFWVGSHLHFLIRQNYSS